MLKKDVLLSATEALEKADLLSAYLSQEHLAPVQFVQEA